MPGHRNPASAGRVTSRTTERRAPGTVADARVPPGRAAMRDMWWRGRCPRMMTAKGQETSDRGDAGSCHHHLALARQRGLQHRMQCRCTPVISMLCHDALPRRVTDRCGTLRGKRLHDVDYVTAVACHQHFTARRQEHLDTVPGVGDEAGARASDLEQPGGRRIAGSGHAGAVDVEDGARRDIEGVVKLSPDMTDAGHIGWAMSVVPAGTTEQEALT